MSELSPAAKTVLDAFLGDAENTGLQMDDLRENVAAALRAAADQVVPEMTTPWNSTLTPKVSAVDVRAQLLVIADELEAQ
jgi:hypothetical protein